jgi:hypothetical protein
MILPYSTIEPFGETGIPTIALLKVDPVWGTLEYLFAKMEDSFDLAFDRWKIIQKARAIDITLREEWPIGLFKLPVELGGGKDVECNVHEIPNGNDVPIGFYIFISFKYKNHKSRYGSGMECNYGKRV